MWAPAAYKAGHTDQFYGRVNEGLEADLFLHPGTFDTGKDVGWMLKDWRLVLSFF